MNEKKRLVIISLGLFSLFSLLLTNYFRIQIVEEEKWSKQARLQHEIIVQEPFRRGTFYSNTTLKQGYSEAPRPFVFDVTKFHLFIDPLSIPVDFREEVAAVVVDQLSLDSEAVYREFEKKSRSRRVAMWLDREQKDRLLKWWRPYARQHKIATNAFFFVTDYQRSYPYGKLLGQVLHTIRDIKDESTHEGLPTGGLEAYFNTYLRGKMGKRKLLRSPLNRLEIDQLIEPPEDGADIYLTINHCLQAIVEEELEKGVTSAQAKGGWAVMMDPYSGEILAMAQYPFFHPENYSTYFNDSEKMEDAKVKAATDAFELGSIMKPITVSIALKANECCRREGRPPLFDPNEKMDVTRTLFPGRKSRPLKAPHTALNLEMAIQKSSNTYMAQLADRIIEQFGKEWYRQMLIDTFGLATKTGVELPGETPGMLPRPGKLHANGALEWSKSTPYSLAFGYNLMATSLQMARAYSVIANGGILVEPTLVRQVVKQKSDGSKCVLVDNTRSERQMQFPRVFGKEQANLVKRAMKYTTQAGGTGCLAAINGYTEAGKTGTAEKLKGGQYAHRVHISSFIGMAPANLDEQIKTRFVLIVTIDEPAPIFLEGGLKNYLGGRCAAPVFKEIARRSLEYMGETPDDPHGYPSKDPRYDPELADWAPEVKALKLLYDQWNRR